MKKDYKRPTAMVVALRQQTHLLGGSPEEGEKGITNSGYSKQSSGFSQSQEEE